MDCQDYTTMQAERKRRQYLQREDRGAIQRLKRLGYSNRAIAREIGCAPTTVGVQLALAICYLLNLDHFDSMAEALPEVEGKDTFLERYTSFRTTVNAARVTFNNLQIATAKELIAGATYTMTLKAATNEAIVKSTIERVISGISLGDEVSTTVTKVAYTPAVAGDAEDPNETNGTYTFTVGLTNGSATGSTATLAMIITATPFVDL